MSLTGRSVSRDCLAQVKNYPGYARPRGEFRFSPSGGGTDATARIVAALLEKAGHNLSLAARRAGLSRVYLHELIKKHGFGRPT